MADRVALSVLKRTKTNRITVLLNCINIQFKVKIQFLDILNFRLYVYFKLYVYFEWSPPVVLKNDAGAPATPGKWPIRFLSFQFSN